MEAIFTPIAMPFGMLLLWLYDLVNNYALSLVLIAIIVRALVLPFQMKGKRGMLRQSRLQPKIAELQKKHSANKQKLNEEMAKLYKEEGVNPASGCLWNFIQMPIMIALFYAIRQPITILMRVSAELIQESGEIYQRLRYTGYEFSYNFYEEVYQAQWISDHWAYFSEFAYEGLRPISFYLYDQFLNLGDVPQWQVWEFDWSSPDLWIPAVILFLLPIITGAVNFISAGIMRRLSAQPEMAGSMGSVMKMMPLMSVVFGFIVPAALSIFWMVGSALQIGQDVWLTKKYTKILDAEDAERAKIREAREAELEAKRLETERRKAEGLDTSKNKSKQKKKKGDKLEKQKKAAEWEKKNAPPKKEKEEKNNPSRVGNRKFARGRAYDPHRYGSSSVDQDTLDDDDEDFDDDEHIETDAVAQLDASFSDTVAMLDSINAGGLSDDDDDDDDDYDDDDDEFDDEDDDDDDDE